ncbi:PASTA domain-containing protein [Streptomyces sp. enrichment culture]|uniref:PASTA domain-containing protein n=1 Tax=Streptomyces sp. enrichment culture TaxID=1795815 RepID=UPI003F572CF4
MHIRTVAAALAAAALLTLTACEGTDSGGVGSASSGTAGRDADGTPGSDPQGDPGDTSATGPDKGGIETGSEAGADAGSASAPASAALPDFTGQDLQAAQDAAQAAGFYALDDQDASGQNRLQVFDRNWVVCSQDPAPGTHPTDTRVTLFAVKDGESC